jgi:hypothetical protein
MEGNLESRWNSTMHEAQTRWCKSSKHHHPHHIRGSHHVFLRVTTSDHNTISADTQLTLDQSLSRLYTRESYAPSTLSVCN